MRSAERGLVCLGEVGVGNTTVAAALACALLGLEPQDAVGLGAGSDAAMVARKRAVVASALERTAGERDPLRLLAALGGPEIAVLTGVVLGAAGAGAPVVLDGLAASLPGVIAARLEPGVQGHVLAGHVSRERAHALVLRELGLEPLLSLRLRAGEGVGACLAASLVRQGLAVRAVAARTV
ncbi:nicotinate-nucleotide--dimethylbenzimidazole phosphoribosyltransferase [Janibacter sp. G1551]|uniref:nicotinate-nucleotide--dimethylbenzimidazole phosphoribosyltransferase n=1 Tax=Janibacter sp. G1551 TaxID=3420440 RepID=UPI003D01704E